MGPAEAPDGTVMPSSSIWHKQLSTLHAVRSAWDPPAPPLPWAGCPQQLRLLRAHPWPRASPGMGHPRLWAAVLGPHLPLGEELAHTHKKMAIELKFTEILIPISSNASASAAKPYPTTSTCLLNASRVVSLESILVWFAFLSFFPVCKLNSSNVLRCSE